MNQDKLKIAFLHRANDPYTLERIKHFSDNNHIVYSIIFDLGEPISKQTNYKVIKLRKTVFDKIPFAKRIIHYFEIKSILQQITPDVLHVVNALNLLYLNYKYHFVKVIENQGSDVLQLPQKCKMILPFYKHLYKKVDAVIQDSKIACEYGKKYGAPKDNYQNKIIEIGIDFCVFNKDVPKGIVRRKFNLTNRPLIFYSRGIIDPLYNVDIVIESIVYVKNNFPNCKYILTTNREELSSQLLVYIKKHNLEKNIMLVGHQHRINDLKYYYRDANVNISVPSSDSSPFSVYESMACLTPNVVSDLPWLYNNFKPEKHLLVCPVRNAKALADKITNVLKGDHNLDLLSAYNIVYEKINLIKENKKLEILYRTIIEKIKYHK